MALLILMTDGVATHRFPLDQAVTTIGRAADNDIHIDDPLVSGRHAVIERLGEEESDGYRLRDLDSTNGSFVNEEKVATQRLRHDDRLRFGLHGFKFVGDQLVDIEKTRKIKKSWIPGVYYTKD